MAVSGNFKNSGQENNEKAAWWQPAIAMFLKLSAWIAAPVIIALYLGKWLDKKYDSAPWLFLSLTALAFLVSMFALIKNTLSEYRKIEKEGERERKINKNSYDS